MELSQITDIKELKAGAYDLVVQLENIQNTLRLVNARIQELMNLSTEAANNDSQERKKEDK